MTFIQNYSRLIFRILNISIIENNFVYYCGSFLNLMFHKMTKSRDSSGSKKIACLIFITLMNEQIVKPNQMTFQLNKRD